MILLNIECSIVYLVLRFDHMLELNNVLAANDIEQSRLGLMHDQTLVIIFC